MPVELNHTIIPARDKRASAQFLGHILDVPVGDQWGPFIPVTVSNGVTLDYADAEQIQSQHFCFLVTDDEFDAAFARIRENGVKYYADPHHQQPGEINHHWGGRGVYFDDPNGHNMEIITKPYGENPAG
jgi:catechol 2,3-dioxygenase-like lactoylglutathione lyase family enzyme